MANPKMVQHFLDAEPCANTDCWVHASMPDERHYHIGGGWGVATRSWVLGVRWAAEQYDQNRTTDER